MMDLSVLLIGYYSGEIYIFDTLEYIRLRIGICLMQAFDQCLYLSPLPSFVSAAAYSGEHVSLLW